MHNPHPWAEELPRLHEHLWSRLIRGVHDRHAPARHPVLATVSSQGEPQARTVVLREADKQAATLTFYTDLHSAKVLELTNTPKASLHIWDASAHLQTRIQADVSILSGDDVRERWKKVPEHSRSAYSTGSAPGQPIADSLAYTKTPDPAAFAVLHLKVQAIDALHLGSYHRRARFQRIDDWAGQWLVP
ncbi:pyridoxamine 5'-phosphate oxidase family protein [Halomonas sp. LS-001]